MVKLVSFDVVLFKVVVSVSKNLSGTSGEGQLDTHSPGLLSVGRGLDCPGSFRKHHRPPQAGSIRVTPAGEPGHRDCPFRRAARAGNH